jgi:hypothetical protein
MLVPELEATEDAASDVSEGEWQLQVGSSGLCTSVAVRGHAVRSLRSLPD